MVLKEDNNSSYFFDGYKFADYIKVEKFKKEVTEATNIKTGTELDLGAFYEHVLNQKDGSKKIMDKIFFDNIFYSHLKNVFVCNIESHPNLQSNIFKTKVKELIKKRNHKDTIPNIMYSFMSENGFYLMDSLNIKSINTKFIAGLDIIENNNQVENLRILFVEVASKNQKTIYYVSAIEINFKENIALVLMRNVTGLSKDEESNTTVHQLYNDVIKKVFTPLNIKVSDIQVDDDRKGMYKFCKILDENLLADIRLTVKKNTNALLNNHVNELNKALFPKNNRLNNIHIKELAEKIEAQLLSYYIEYNITPNELVKKAKSLKQVGYATKIRFTSTKSSRSSTSSSSSRHPVSASDMFHGLYFNFKQALKLDRWSICWFTDYDFKKPNDVDIIQTTIQITKNNFHLIFHPTRPLNKEIIFYVIRTINSYR